MELSKTNALKVILMAAVTATVCLVAVVLFGWSLRAFWEFDANRKLQNAQLEKLRAEIVKAEDVVASKHRDVALIAEKWREYSELTNAINKAKQSIAELNKHLEGISKNKTALGGEIAALQNAVSLTNSLLLSKCDELKSVKSELVEGERQKKLLAGLAGEIASKKQELENIDRAIEAKEGKQAKLESSYFALQTLAATAHTNLSAMTEQASGLQSIMGLRKETIASMESEIKMLEERKKTLTKDNDDIEKSILMKSPKEKTLMNRLAELAGQYLDATNQLAMARTQLKQEIAEAQAEVDADTQLKNKQAEEQLARAKAVVADAEVKASGIVSDAKTAAAEIEKTTKTDKESAEKARLEKSSAELAAAQARKARIDDEERSKAAVERLAELTVQIKAAEKTALADKEKAASAKVELEKIQAEVAALKETEERLAESIAARQKALKKLAEDNDK